MNFFKVFEDRIAHVLGTTSQKVAPFSFKKLAREATTQLKKETYEIDGQLIAPALFTILISPSAMRQIQPVYKNLTKEIQFFLQAQADRKALRFLADPVIRFVSDQEVKHSKFYVFAENIDIAILDKVRAEEVAFLTEHQIPGAPVESAHQKKLQTSSSQHATSAPDPKPVRNTIASTPLVGAQSGNATTFSPRTAKRYQPAETQTEALLIDRASGRTYPVLASSTVIGREGARGTVVLQDVNVSRRHAEITYEHGTWMIVDLNSTNGTLVNNTDITEVALHDGDLITVGLTNLEFKEN